ncbi:hypothetical protein RND71_035739 [Anisodus tanguticus]|uniref:Uncharacterized protein n=1 Tax=Anisodus tanguticus TaxID=243964 RepID=A0AAE1UUQ6_9SOLA|nr:hypothetical protein RND71_035739 [Anisodus tanguticus]
MGTSCLFSTLHRFPVDYPVWLVSRGYSYTSCCLHNSPKRLQATATSTVSGDEKRMKARKPITAAILAAAAACSVIVAVNGTVAVAAQIEMQQEIIGEETFSNVPQTLSGECVDGQKECKKARIQRPKSRQAESCTVKCVNTCIRGGSGSPGEGPLNVRRPLVVFKQGFRSRQYCLVECSDICNLIKDGEDGP